MDVPACGLALIRAFEGCRLSPYQDSAGIWTIGIGSIFDHQMHRVSQYTPGLTNEEAEQLLARDSRKAFQSVLLLCPGLAEYQTGSLLSFAYNLGTGALQASTLRRAINRGDPVEADYFLRWNKAGGRVIPGLTRRRAAEYALFCKG